MAIDNSGAKSGNPFHLETQAFRLWTFVHRRVSSFTRDQALATLRELEPSDRDEIKQFAKRLQIALEKHRAKITHTAALRAATLVLQGQDWHKARQGQLIYALKLLSFTDELDESLADWHQAGQRLITVCETHLQQHPAVRAFQVESTSRTLVVSALEVDGEPGSREWLAIPIAVISPMNENEQWLTGVARGLETLRRRVEETHLAVLDGLAVLDWCDRRGAPWFGLPGIAAADVRNSELVLTREDNAGMPGSGFEVTRGDEIACWTQFELALNGEVGAIAVGDDGAWTKGEARFIWTIATLKPKKFIPALAVQQLGPSDAGKLLRRYHLAKRILGRKLPLRAGHKHLDYLGAPAKSYRIDVRRLEAAMSKACVTWEAYCKEIGEAGRELMPELPLEFVLPLLERLGVSDPDDVFARPPRADLARADDDSVLRALLPRVDHVRYRTCQGLTPDAAESIREAIAELGASLMMRMGVFQTEDPLPDFVYANDGEELMAKLAQLGLEAYVGVMPHLRKLPEAVNDPSGRWPYAFGHSLYLDIDRQAK